MNNVEANTITAFAFFLILFVLFAGYVYFGKFDDDNKKPAQGVFDEQNYSELNIITKKNVGIGNQEGNIATSPKIKLRIVQENNKSCYSITCPCVYENQKVHCTAYCFRCEVNNET